jgi:hypothetical protein
MARGRLVLYVAPPGFRSALEFARVFAGTEGSVLTSSANSLLANLHHAITRDDNTLAKIEAGSLEILPFNEFIRRLASASGAPLFPILSLEYQRALMALACQTIPEHSEFAPVKAIPGFHDVLLQIARELRHYQIPLDALRLLGRRTSEVADVLSHYRQILWEHKVGTLSDRIEVLLNYPLQAPATLENVFWCGETEIPPLWCEGIKWLLDGGVNVHFLIETHWGREDFFPLPHERQEPFSGAEVRHLDVPVPKAGKVFSLKDFPTLEGRVEILETGDGITECEWAMRAVLGFLREGVKPGEVGIYCRSLSDYAPYLNSAARRLGLTLKMEYQQKLFSNPFVGTVLTALRACLPEGWRLLPPLLQSPYSDTSPASGQKVEEVLLGCGQSDAPWRALARMRQEHPDLVPPWLGRLAEWREFAHSYRGTLGDWCQLLSRLLGMMPWLDASLRSGTPTVDRDLSAQDAMIRSLRASTASVPPDTRFSLSEFVAFVEQLWRDAEYTLRYRGEIPVVTEAMALGDVQWVVALGVVEGRFPKRRMEVPILNDEKREALAQQNPQWRLPTSYDRAREEEQEFYRLVCSAPNILLCYPHKILDHHEVPAFFLSDLQESVPGVKHSCKPIEQRFPLPAECLHSADLFPSLEWYRDSIPEEVKAWEQRLSEEQRKQRERFRLSAQNSLSHELRDEGLKQRFSALPRSLTFSLLRSLARCRFQYFARAHLNFSATRPVRTGRRLDRLVQKVDLVNVRSPEELREALIRLWSEELEKTKPLTPPEEWELFRLSEQALLEDFSRREFYAREEWGLVPEKQNLSLQQAGFRTAVKVQGLDLTLDEHIDILYRRGEDVVPLRLGYASPSSDRESFLDNALLLALMPQPKEERISLMDDLEGRRRVALAGPRSGRTSQLSEKPDKGLLVGPRHHSSKFLVDEAKKHLQEVIQMAISGDITPTPGRHCELCSLGSLCRLSQNSTLLDPRYDSLLEEGVFGGGSDEGVAE